MSSLQLLQDLSCRVGKQAGRGITEHARFEDVRSHDCKEDDEPAEGTHLPSGMLCRRDLRGRGSEGCKSLGLLIARWMASGIAFSKGLFTSESEPAAAYLAGEAKDCKVHSLHVTWSSRTEIPCALPGGSGGSLALQTSDSIQL